MFEKASWRMYGSSYVKVYTEREYVYVYIHIQRESRDWGGDSEKRGW